MGVSGGMISNKSCLMVFSIVLILFFVMGSVSALDLNSTVEDTNDDVFSNDLEVSEDSISNISSHDDKKSYSSNDTELLGFSDGVKRTHISANDMELYYGNGSPFKVVLSDDEGSLLANKIIIFTINNVDYTRTTNEYGVASIAINLKSGNYDISSFYAGDENYASFFTTNNVKVLSTIYGQDIVKYYKNDTQYYASFFDGQGNFLSGAPITFNINGVFYQRKTDENGLAKLNINLLPGEYILTAINSVNGDMFSNIVDVLPTMSADDLNMNYKDGHKFTVNVIDDVGNPLAKSNVVFNVNGVFYTRVTDNEGNAHLNINLDVGEYIITATNYRDLSISKKINIAKSNSVIKANNIHMLPGLNRNYKVILTDLNSKAIPSVPINFRFNGVSTTAFTNENGEATILISNPSEGKYSIEYGFEGNINYQPCKSSSTIVVDNSNTILIGNDLKKTYGDDSKFTATLTDLNFVPMANEDVTFNVFGKTYVRTTDENGVAKLNINLYPGTYEISYSYSTVGSTDYSKGSNTIVVSKMPAYLSTNDLVFVYGNSGTFTATLTDASKNPLEAIDVTFNINGKEYIRTTDALGVAKLNIGLSVGYYDITTSLYDIIYAADTRFNHVLVDGAIFTAYDITVFPGYTRDFSVTLLDAYKNPISNALIEFSYNGISKHATTDAEGIATISVGNLAKGDYQITYKYSERNTSGISYIFALDDVLNTKNKISDLTPYLTDSSNCQVSNPEIVSLARQLTGGLTNPWDKARAIFNYVRDTISYDYYYDTYYGAVGTMHSEEGNCVDQAHLVIALYRAAGLPARYVHGSCVFNSGTTYGHVWSQVLIDDFWIAGDTISAGNSLDRVVNWNNYNYKLHGYFSDLPF